MYMQHPYAYVHLYVHMYVLSVLALPAYIKYKSAIIESMGWLRLVGSLKLQVSFAKETYTRDDILQKRPIILRSLLIVATPYGK